MTVIGFILMLIINESAMIQCSFCPENLYLMISPILDSLYGFACLRFFMLKSKSFRLINRSILKSMYAVWLIFTEIKG